MIKWWVIREVRVLAGGGSGQRGSEALQRRPEEAKPWAGLDDWPADRRRRHFSTREVWCVMCDECGRQRVQREKWSDPEAPRKTGHWGKRNIPFEWIRDGTSDLPASDHCVPDQMQYVWLGSVCFFSISKILCLFSQYYPFRMSFCQLQYILIYVFLKAAWHVVFTKWIQIQKKLCLICPI